MGSQARTLELKVLDCKDLKAFNFFQKLSVYALVSLVSDHPNKKKLEKQQQQQRTPRDTQGDRNPEWNHRMRFDLGGRCTTSDGGDDDDDDHLFLHFDLRSELAIFGDKSVGEVRVLLKDLISNNKEEEEKVGYQFSSDSGIVHFVSYQVRTSDGKPNGVLSFAYKVLMKENDGGGGATATSIGNVTTINSLEGNSCSNFPNNNNNYNNVHIDGYPIISHIISGSSSSSPSNSQVHYPSLLPEDYLQNPSGSGQSYYSAAVAPHQLHFPTFETPDSAPPGNGYINYCYPQPPPPPPHHDQFHYPPSAALLPPVLPPPFPPPPPPHVGQGSVYHQPQSPWVYDGTRYEW